MTTTDQLQAMGDFLWEFLTDEPPSLEEQQEQLTARVVDALEEAGFRGISNEELVDALDGVSERLTAEQQAGLQDLSEGMSLNLQATSMNLTSSLTQDFEAGLEGLRAEQIEPLKAAIANQPAPVINQISNVTRVTRVTNIDDRQVINTNNVVEEGGNLNQNIVQGDDGAVVVGGNIEDSAVNTGVVDGVQAGGDVDIDDSVVGDQNTVIDDNEGTIAVGGDATNIEIAPPEPLPIDEPPIDDGAAAVDAAEDAFDAAAAAADADAAALEADIDA